VPPTDPGPAADVVATFVAGLTAASPEGRRAVDARLGPAVDLLGRGPVEWAVELVRAEDLRAGPIGRRPRSPVGLIPAALEHTAVRFLLALAGRGGPGVLSEDQRDLIRSAVHQDVPFDQMREGFRRMQHRWTRFLLQQAGADRPAEEQRELTEGLVLRAAGFFDEQIDLVVAEYLGQRERLLSNEVVERAEAVLAILAREPVPADRAAQVLGMPIDAAHLALVLFPDGDDVALARRATERVLGEAREVFGCRHSLSVAGPDGTVWLWLTREGGFPSDAAARLAARPLPGASLRLAVGRPAPGLEGFRRSHLAALDALRIARAGAAPAGRVVDHGAVSLLALLSQDGERAKWFAAEELGPLAGEGPELEELRRTVMGFLDTRSQAETAARLFLHRNTVRHRLQRAEQLLGHPLAERAEEVWAALRLLALR
jgi:DNA-binding PucR family transcriptional regulator